MMGEMQMNKKISLVCIFLCVGLCACHNISPDHETGLERETVFQEVPEEKTDFLEAYHNFCEQENVEKIALLYLDEDAVPELLIRKDREYEMYSFDGSKVQPIPMSDAGIKANTYGAKHDVEDYGKYQTPYWFEYVPRQGLVRVHEDGKEERHDYYLRYTDGVLSKEFETWSDGSWHTCEGDEEIANEDFRSRLTEMGYDSLIPCAYLYDSVAAAYENRDAVSDSKEVLEDFVNGKVDALCYEDVLKRGTPTEEGFFLRNYEEIYGTITCGETWWGSLKYVDFDNDGEDELVLGGYTGSRMFFDVIGDTVYEVLQTSGTADNGYVAEMNGRKVIERTDLLHSGRQCYQIIEYDSCCCVVDQFSLCTYFEGHHYTEGDEFKYRDREITMEEFEELVGSIHSVSVENRILEYWVGEYEFRESVSEPILMMMDYRMKIYRDNDTYYADIEIDGQTTLARIRAEAGLESGSDRIELVFCEYLPGHINGGANAEEGEVLLVLERKNGEILTHWGKIVPMLYENEESGKVYFVKKQESGDLNGLIL